MHVAFTFMKFANEALFLVFSLLLSGLLISAIPYIRKSRLASSNGSWLIALVLHIVAFLAFAAASTISPILLTVANVCFFGGYLYLTLFCFILNGHSIQKISRYMPLVLLIFAGAFEYLRLFGNFQYRVLFVLTCVIACLLCILWELFQVRKKEKQIQLSFLMFTSAAELIFGLTRLWLVFFDTPTSNINLYQEPFLSTLLRWFAVTFTALSYVSIVGYWSEKLVIENSETKKDNAKITELLQEREALIVNLLKANKTAATGALSASIAHELNQPLGASDLNIQFLKMKLKKGELNSELGAEILDALEFDNKRATTIVRSLRSIFTDSNIETQGSDLGELITTVLHIANPDLKSKNIQIQLHVDEGLVLNVGPGEMEQVMINLLNNAIQAIDDSNPLQPKITIEARKKDQTAVITIADNGGGIPEEFQASLFELLSTTKKTGMGLGLWLCKNIVSRHGGTITYDGIPGSSSLFTIKIPLQA